MKASILSIGCDFYGDSRLTQLSGAQNDSKNIFQCLVESEFSIYNVNHSKLLLSPTLAEVRSTLKFCLFDEDRPDIFTIFFAGHGGIIDGTYYVFTSDSDLDLAAFTALSLAELFKIIASSKVMHVNIVIDACNTAGLVNDLFAVIKSEVIGARGTFGFSILAASANDEYALETEGQGIFTKELVRSISGEQKITVDFPYLDLISIGRSISQQFELNGINQRPTAWGFNLFGPSIFSKNPFFDFSGSSDTRYFSFIPPASKVGELLSTSKSEFWSIYEKFDDESNTQDFVNLLDKVSRQASRVEDSILIIEGIGYQFLAKYASIRDFRELEIINAMCTCLIPFYTHERTNVLLNQLRDLFEKIATELFKTLTEKLKADKYSLILGRGDGLNLISDLYYLPIRVSKLLGYASQSILANSALKPVMDDFIFEIKETYSANFVCVSEVQTPFIFSFLSVFSKPPHEIVKAILISYSANYLSYRGEITPYDTSSERACKFLIERSMMPSIDPDLRAKPDSLGTVLLLAANKFGLEEEFDSYLHLIDGHDCFVFVPFSGMQFGDQVISDGTNITLQCGYNFFSCEEFRSTLLNEFNKLKLPPFEIDEFFTTACTFTRPNRFLLDSTSFS